MDFALLQKRLIAHIRARVRGGEVTERRLARVTGISQPHVHNVLKGVRALSPELADHLLRELRINLLDLLEPEEMKRHLLERGEELRRLREVPLLAGRIGPGHPYPQSESRYDAYPFPSLYVDLLKRPVTARVARDDHLPAPLQADDVVLLEQHPLMRNPVHAFEIYVVSVEGQAMFRHVQVHGDRVYVLGRGTRDCIQLAGGDILEIVKAKVLWFGRRLEQIVWRPPSLPHLD
jgi:transcriptional regulator with XRE-family HTH domain